MCTTIHTRKVGPQDKNASRSVPAGSHCILHSHGIFWNGILSVIHIAKKLKLTQEEMILSLLLSSCPWLPSRALRGWGYKMEHHSHLQGLWLGKKWEFWCLLAGPMFGSSFSVFLYFLVSNRTGHQMGIRVLHLGWGVSIRSWRT